MWYMSKKYHKNFICYMCKTSRNLFFFAFGIFSFINFNRHRAMWSTVRSRVKTSAKNHAKRRRSTRFFFHARMYAISRFESDRGRRIWRRRIIARRSRNFHGIFSRSDRPITPVLIVMIWFIRNYSCRCCARINAVHSCRAGRRTVFIPWIISWELHAAITREW